MRNETMIALVFYKGKGNWIDWCIRFATRSKFSHVELMEFTPKFDLYDREYDCFSASARDGGVREKKITLSPDKWRFVPIRWGDKFEHLDQAREIGKKYDFKGILFSQFFSFGRHNKKRWFCSEICAAYLGFSHPQTYSPQRLFEAVNQMNESFRLGYDHGLDDGQ